MSLNSVTIRTSLVGLMASCIDAPASPGQGAKGTRRPCRDVTERRGKVSPGGLKKPNPAFPRRPVFGLAYKQVIRLGRLKT